MAYYGQSDWGRDQLEPVLNENHRDTIADDPNVIRNTEDFTATASNQKNIRNCNKYWFKDVDKCADLVNDGYKFPGRLRKMTGYRISKGGSRRRRSRRYTLRKK